MYSFESLLSEITEMQSASEFAENPAVLATEAVNGIKNKESMDDSDLKWTKEIFEKIFSPVTENADSRDTAKNADVQTTLKQEYHDEPGVGRVLVTGNPFELGENLDDCQGDNKRNYGGDCGVVTLTNILRMAGLDVTEDDVLNKGCKMHLVDQPWFASPENKGGTSVYGREKLLEAYGIDCSVTDDKNGTGSLDSLAKYVENGHGVNISTNAGYEWNELSAVENGYSNHSIAVTGTARNPETGELKGLYVCDSGLTDRNSKALFLSVEVLEKCYVNTPGTSALITDKPIR